MPSCAEWFVRCVDGLKVGPGTGVAPFRAWVQESTFAQAKAKEAAAKAKDATDQKSVVPKPAIGPIHLFFGCRNSTKDFIYKVLPSLPLGFPLRCSAQSLCTVITQDEITKAAETGVISKLHVAFSRESKEVCMC
jgi:sulfite reductase alpha subunit-like flavoprotein